MNHGRVLSLLLIVVLCVAGAAGTAFCATRLYRDAVLRSGPSHLSTPLSTLKRGSHVTILDEQDAWRKVRAGKQQGWLSDDAFQEPPALTGGSGGAVNTVSPGTASLAGKGFDQETENEARKSSSNNFAAVDIMRSYAVSRAECEAFLRAGREGVGK